MDKKAYIGTFRVHPTCDGIWTSGEAFPTWVDLELWWNTDVYDDDHCIHSILGSIVNYEGEARNWGLLYTDSGVSEQVNTYLASLRAYGLPIMRAYWSEQGLQGGSSHCHFDAGFEEAHCL